MPDWLNRIDEKKVFIDLFDIYEQELLTIFQYVAPITKNIKWNVPGNKIHELLIRIGAECENLTKEVLKIYKCKCASKKMPCYIEELNKKLKICSKKILFNQFVDNKDPLIQPFKIKSGNEDPEWWIHYNGIKHHKIKKYLECWLSDVINSLWAYYILLNYFVLDGPQLVYRNNKINSKIFKPTIWWIKYPKNITEGYGWYENDWELPYMQLTYVTHDDSRITVLNDWDQEVSKFNHDVEKANSERKLCYKMSWEENRKLNQNNYLFYNILVQEPLKKTEDWNELKRWLLKWETKLNV